MAPLANLGQPFGSPHQTFNIPAPAGSGNAAAMQMQAAQSFGGGLGNLIRQVQEKKRQEEDMAALQQYQQQQQAQQQQQQGLGSMDALSGALGGVLPNNTAGITADMIRQAPQAQMPQFKSQAFRGAQSQNQMNQIMNPMAGQQQAATLDYTRARTEALQTPKPSKIQELIAEGYSPTEARMIRDISHGIKPRASARKQYDNMGDVEKLDFLNNLEKRAKGQYFGVTEGFEKAVDQNTLKWVEQEKGKLKLFDKPAPQTNTQEFGPPVQTPTTQAEFDAIPKGTLFVDTDGKRKTKQ